MSRGIRVLEKVIVICLECQRLRREHRTYIALSRRTCDDQTIMGSLRWIAMVAVAGCATGGIEMVPDSDWQTVPVAERAMLDNANATELAKAQADLRISIALAERARTAVAAQPPRHKLDASGDAAHERADALARVDSAAAARARAELVWRERRIEVAREQVALLATQRELDRAHAVDRNMTGDDYPVALYRGQLAQAQVRWYAATERADAAHADLERAMADVSSAKEAFAQLVRGDADALAAAERALKLPGWSTDPTETGHRRGLVFVSASAPLVLHQRGLHRAAIAPLLR